MAIMNIRKIVMIGSGRLASSLSMALKETGFDIIQVYNRSSESGKKLAERTGAEYACNLKGITLKGDLYIIAVADDAVSGILNELDTGNKFVVHTSGALPMNILNKVSENTGVIYPLFTFSGKGKKDFRRIPVCIEANSKKNLEVLNSFASQFSDHVKTMTSADRLKVHLAAVFANNFTNFMVAVAGDLLIDAKIDPDILESLIRQTSKNIIGKDPFLRQTGPAVRGDELIMKKHLKLLQAYPDYQKIYRQISYSILKMKKKHG